MNNNYSLENLSEIASEIIVSTKNKTLLFYGEMGVGKTTLIKEICKELGVLDNISSPTFSLVNEYQTIDNSKVFHFDFYRINKIEEVMDIGYEDYVYSGNYCLMEWPKKIEKLLPENIVYVTIENLDDESRSIHINKK